MINTLIFDCFGVLSQSVLMSWYNNHSIKEGFVDNDLLRELEKFDLGQISEEDVFERFSKYPGVKMNVSDIRREVDSYLKFDSKLLGIVLKLKESGYKTVLLSNTHASFFEREVYVKYPDFKNLFDEIIISSDVGMIKPSKEIYLYALEKIKSKPEESLMIDDSFRNIEGAKAVGINGFVYSNLDSFLEYLRINNLID